MQNLFYYGLILICTVITVYDFIYYKIPNKFLAVLFGWYAAYATYMHMHHNPVITWTIIGITLFSLVIGLVLFNFNLFGAGDIKYFCIAILWMYPINFLSFTLITAISGGMLAVLFMVAEPYCHRVRQILFNCIDKKSKMFVPSKMVPYGVAISIGLISTLINEKIYTL